MRRGRWTAVAVACLWGVAACTSATPSHHRSPASSSLATTTVASTRCEPVYVTGDDLSDRDPVAAATTWSDSAAVASSFSSTQRNTAALAVGNGSQARISGARVSSAATHAPGLQVTAGGRLLARSLDIATEAGRSTGLSVQENGSLACLRGGSVATNGKASPAAAVSAEATLLAEQTDFATSGADSPAISATGGTTIVKGGSLSAERSAGVAAAAPVSLTSVTLTSVAAAFEVGDRTRLSLTGSRVVARADAIDVVGGAVTVAVTGGDISSADTFLRADGGATKATTAGATITPGDGALARVARGASVDLTVNSGQLQGDLIAAKGARELSLELDNAATWTGALNSGSLTLDSSSGWVVTGDSQLTYAIGLQIADGTVTNARGDGHRVTYDSTLDANSYLGGQTYRLTGGGSLVPR